VKTILRLSFALVLCCAVAAAVLALADHVTAAARAQAQLAEKRRALATVLPAFDNDPIAAGLTVTVQLPDDKKPRELRFYPALKDGRLVGVAGETHTVRGYGGRIDLLAGITPEGAIRAIVVTAHRETPGLGSLLVERQTKKTLAEVMHGGSAAAAGTPPPLAPNRYLDQYAAPQPRSLLQPDAFRIRRDGGDVEPVSGATVTSRAVADAVRALAQAYRDHQDDIRRTGAASQEPAP
jgi:electron transport complex protein RnfG